MRRVFKLLSLRQWAVGCGLGSLLVLLSSPLPASHARAIGHTPFGRARQEVRALAPGEAVERVLGSGQIDSYRLTIAPGEYIVVSVTEGGPNLIVTLVGPTGQKVAESNNTISRLEMLSLVAEAGGEFRLNVRLADKAASARYEVKIADRRAATPEDGERVRAERAFEGGASL